MKLILVLFIFIYGIGAHSNECKRMFQELGKDKTEKEKIVTDYERNITGLIERYKDALFPHDDPFALAYNVETGERIFRGLTFRETAKGIVRTPLAYINNELKRHFNNGNTPINRKVLDLVVKDSLNLLSQRRVSRNDLQSNLLALKFSLEYLRRFKEPEVIVDRNGKPEGKKAQKEEKQKDSEEMMEEDTKPEYPELPKSYKPQTNDTQGGKGKQKKYRIAEVNFKTPLFAQRYFSQIVRGNEHPFQEGILPQRFSPIGKFKDTGKEMVVRTFGKTEVSLFVPSGYRPRLPSDSRVNITRAEEGGYILTLSEPLKEVKIPLEEDIETLMPPTLEVYSRPTGFVKNEWPEKIQIEILRKLNKGDDPLKIAQKIADHIATQYLYSVGERKETDPIEALKGGAFQCDMAAFIMAGLLRDEYGIPCRVVGGFRAKKYLKDSKEMSYLIVPGEAHAWVEVYHDGKWHSFNPTPVKKDKKDKGGEKDEYQDQVLENTPKPEDNDMPPSDNAGKGDETKKQDHKKRVDETSEKRTQDLPKKDAAKTDKKMDIDELIKELEIGSLDIESSEGRNPLLDRSIRMLLSVALDPSNSGKKALEYLHKLGSILNRYPSNELKAFFNEALIAHREDHPPLKEWIGSLEFLMKERDLNTAYKELLRIKKAATLYSRVLDVSGKVSPPTELLNELTQVQHKLFELSHPDGADIGIVNDFYRNLPAIPRLALKREYGIESVGPNAATRTVAKSLREGRLNDMKLLSILSPLTDFILNSTKRPDTMNVKAWMPDANRTCGRDLLPLQNFSDISRAILGKPGQSIEENIKNGTAFVQTRRKRVKVPMGHSNEDAEKITIVGYDTSGSMSGEPARFQAGLISAFVSNALSDLSPSGRHRHKVVLIPFDDKVGEPVKVTNTEEAIETITGYRSKLKNTGGGTDIQKFLMNAMALIADTEKRSKDPLAAANIIVMTDGQSNIDFDELSRARNTIARETPLQAMFVAINQTSEELMRFAMESQGKGFEKGFYREFDASHIQDILNEADNLDSSAKAENFYTEKGYHDVPDSAFPNLEMAGRHATQFERNAQRSSKYESPLTHVEKLNKLKWRDIPHIDRSLEKWLMKFRGFVYSHPVFEDRAVLERVVDDIMNNFESVTGIKLSDLSDYEKESLNHLVRYAAGLEGAL